MSAAAAPDLVQLLTPDGERVEHRLVDGELGSKVLADVAAILEQPKRLITWA